MEKFTRFTRLKSFFSRAWHKQNKYVASVLTSLLILSFLNHFDTYKLLVILEQNVNWVRQLPMRKTLFCCFVNIISDRMELALMGVCVLHLIVIWENVQAIDFSSTASKRNGTETQTAGRLCLENRTLLIESKRLSLPCMFITECWGGNGV